MSTTAANAPLTSKSKSDQILKSLPEIKSGDVLVACVEPTSNPEYVQAMFVQSKKNGTSDLQALALGWDASVERCWMNFKADQAAVLVPGMKATDVFRSLSDDFDEDIHIRIIHSLEPRTATLADGRIWTQSPLRSESNGQIRTFVNAKNQPIYKTTELATSDELDETMKGSMQHIVENEAITA